MTNIKKFKGPSFIILLILSIFLASCKKTLLEKPKSIAVESFYNTNLEIESAVNGIYSPLRAGESMNVWYLMVSDALGDFLLPNGSWTPLEKYQGLDATNRARTGNFWKDFYLSIRNANLVIKKVPGAKEVNDVNKKAFIGEAKFMRALVYFQLVQNWGAVPLRTEDNMDLINLPRTPTDSVFHLIIEDLKYAEQNLPSTVDVSGHPTKWSAKAVLANVYLYLKQYKEAEDEAEEIIQSGLFSLYPVKTPNDFLKVFGPDVDKSSEEIFYLKYLRLPGQGSQLPLYEGHPNTPYANGAGYFSMYTDPTLVKTVRDWDNNDLRKQYSLYPFLFGRGDSTYLIRKFQDINALSNGTGGNAYPWYGYADVLLYYAEAANDVNNGPTDNAIEALNEIHRRAYGYPPDHSSPIDYKIGDYTKNSFLNLIIKERGYETFFEGKRWMDLKRLGIARQYIKNSKGIDVSIKNLLWPIPDIELNYNKAIDPSKDQNPGY